MNVAASIVGRMFLNAVRLHQSHILCLSCHLCCGHNPWLNSSLLLGDQSLSVLIHYSFQQFLFPSKPWVFCGLMKDMKILCVPWLSWDTWTTALTNPPPPHVSLLANAKRCCVDTIAPKEIWIKTLSTKQEKWTYITLFLCRAIGAFSSYVDCKAMPEKCSENRKE